MAFDWLQFLNNAREQAGIKTAPPSTEAKGRTAISRAYYAAFHLAQNHLRVHGKYLEFVDIYSHRDVITQFMAGPEDTHYRIGSNLDELFGFRKKADYYASSDWLETLTVQMCVRTAERIIRDLDTL
jgi:uncharacterized protein (UPF0332 family)